MRFTKQELKNLKKLTDAIKARDYEWPEFARSYKEGKYYGYISNGKKHVNYISKVDNSKSPYGFVYFYEIYDDGFRRGPFEYDCDDFAGARKGKVVKEFSNIAEAKKWLTE